MVVRGKPVGPVKLRIRSECFARFTAMLVFLRRNFIAKLVFSVLPTSEVSAVWPYLLTPTVYHITERLVLQLDVLMCASLTESSSGQFFWSLHSDVEPNADSGVTLSPLSAIFPVVQLLPYLITTLTASKHGPCSASCQSCTLQSGKISEAGSCRAELLVFARVLNITANRAIHTNPVQQNNLFSSVLFLRQNGRQLLHHLRPPGRLSPLGHAHPRNSLRRQLPRYSPQRCPEGGHRNPSHQRRQLRRV